MKFHIAMVLVGLAVARAAYQYDPAVIDQVIGNPRMISAYTDCLLEVGPCTREGTEAKKIIPEIINTSCANCSEQDKMYAAKLALTLQSLFPEKYHALLKNYDLEGPKLAKLDEFLKQYAS